jgi:hypothetical protein
MVGEAPPYGAIMDTKQLILSNLRQADFVVDGYLADLTDAELLVRPVAGANHIAWQLGHLIASEAYLVSQVYPAYASPLPAGYADKFTKETAQLDAADAFLKKEEYFRLGKEVRAATLGALEKVPDADLDKPATKVPPLAKTVADVYLLVAGHWMMHAGQWAVIRRKLGRPPLF